MLTPTLQDRLQVRERPDQSPVMFQRWSNLLFAHWEADPALVQNRLPRGLHVDTHEGRTYLGLVPFFMEKVRARFLPTVPWLSNFLELNVRCYVHDNQGRPGVWFFSLDCNQPVAVELARRFFHLPYEHARMRSNRGIYHCQRKTEKDKASYQWDAKEGGQEAEPGSLEFFLLERYLLFSASPKGTLKSGRVHHPPYRFHQLPVEPVDPTPLKWNDFAVSGPPISLLASPGVDVEVFPLKDNSPLTP
ncbi:MAG: YqjF family protein [Akkermansiaceae bacterium]